MKTERLDSFMKLFKNTSFFIGIEFTLKKIVVRSVERSQFAVSMWKVISRFLPNNAHFPTAPNLYIVGAQKCATTSLHNYLNHHPDIFMTIRKEPGFLLEESRVDVEGTTGSKIRLNLDDQELKNLLRLGYKNESYWGESSTYYSMSPVFGGEVPNRMAIVCKEPKILYVIRNPIERMVSQYQWGVKNSFFTGELNEALKERYNIYLSISCYFTNIKRYVDIFGMNSVKIVVFDDLKENPISVLENIFDFLEVKHVSYENYCFKTHYKSTKSSNEESWKIDKDIFDKMIPVLEEEIKQLENMFELDLSRWDLSEKRWVRGGQ